MGFFSNLFSRSQFKHNICDAEMSQYSKLPRFYYINGRKYDIDSPESVNSIPIIQTDFIISQDHWGMDAILREHVNRYYSKIPDALKEACYSKIDDFEYSNCTSESVVEKEARLRQEQEIFEKEQKIKAISADDMAQFSFSFNFGEPFLYNQMSISLVDDGAKKNVEADLLLLNSYVKEAVSIAEIEYNLLLPVDQLEYSPKKLDIGTPFERNEYYTFFQYNPYTPTGKLSKYPLILHYATTDKTEFDSTTNYFGKIYYLQDGSIGKADMIFWISHTMYRIELGLRGTTLLIKKIETSENCEKIILYKA